ncbi:hypothetical protein EV361DRAFT_441106 [Lentinula raphanica]|nr:hypothetical protein EV361DRAFT_441106 [Lentinula raphanica]
MRLSLAYLALALATTTSTFAAPAPAQTTSAVTLAPRDGSAIEVVFIGDSKGKTLDSPVDSIEPLKVQEGLERVRARYAHIGESSRPFQVLNGFDTETKDTKGFMCAMTGLGVCKNGFWCQYSVPYDKTKNPVAFGQLPDASIRNML